MAAYLADMSNRIAIVHACGVITEHMVSDNVAQSIIEQATAEPSWR